GAVAPEIRVYTSGNSGSQVCTIQWKNFSDKTTAPVVQYDNISFQIKLYESTNVIEFLYGPWTPSSGSANAKTAGVAIKGSNSSSMVAATKASGQDWSQATFINGNYTGNSNNHRNDFLPDSGRTYQFTPTSQRDAAITNVYSLGKLPIPFAVPHMVEAVISNVGIDTISNMMIYLKVKGSNTFLDSFLYTNVLNAGASDFVYFTTYAPSTTGFDTLEVTTSGDDYAKNDGKVWNINVNLNSYSYTDISKAPAGGIGFTGGTGDFVAKFNSSSANSINQIKVNLTTTGLNYKIAIWDEDPNTGLPNNNVWSSQGMKTAPGQAVVSVNPPVSVSGNFFVGVQQTGTANVGFAYQAETPIRDSIFYYTAPTGNTSWVDFASLGTTNFRFMIEPRLMIPKDAGVIKLVSPTKDTCGGGKLVDLTLQIQNLGLDTIDLTQDSIAVYAAVKGPNDTSFTTYGPTMVNTGYLASNDTLNVTMPAPLDMINLGDYEIYGYTVWPNDSNFQNDTLPFETRQSTGATAIASAIGNTTICNGDTVVLTSGQSVNGITFQWIYNGSSINNAFDTVYYATAAGSYTCAVTNGFGCTSMSDTIVVTLKSAANPTMVYKAAGFCPNDSVLVTASSTSTGLNYQWMLNGSPINGKTDSTIYISSAGDYMVEVTDQATGCKEITAAVNFQAFSSPDTSISVTGNTKFCFGDSVMLSGTAANGNSYQWNLNGNPINGATGVDHYATLVGTYTVSVTSVNGCMANNKGIYIDVDSLPSTKITTSNGTFHFCDLDTLTLYAAKGTGYTYQWNDIGGAIFGETNQSFTLFSAGDYSVTITNANGCTATSAYVTVTSSQSPTADITALANPQFCQGDSLKLEAATTGATYTYQWVLNGNNISNANGTSYYATAGGDYTLKITDGGCTGESLPTSIVQLSSPQSNVTAKNSTTLCAGDSVELDVTAQSSVQTIQWRLNNTAISGATSTGYMASQAGSYNAYVLGTNGCSDISNSITITVNPLPTATATYVSKVLSANTGAGLTYQWYKDGSPIAGANSATYNPVANGKYYVVVSDGNSCDNKSNEITVTDLGFALSEFVYNMNVYPNPSKGLYTLNLDMNNGGKVRMRVTDLSGRVITENNVQVNRGPNFQTIDLTEYSKGVYMLIVDMNGSSTTIKLIKE
ncbi:MAG: T9SS type A sorting domain-containing protein, partial [Bacteroidetes bacterium]|nr:T9SS type A sorting domain-containing protein [Bacteroidota bacterium]